jgi:glycine cleavage system transcriptional repressor
MAKAFVTVLGKDRPGIVADVTGILYETGCNLEDSSMTILEGEFAVLVIISLPKELAVKDLREKFTPITQKGLTVDVKDFADTTNEPEEISQKNFVISVIGADKPGIVYQVSKLLEKHEINITDVETKRIGKESKMVYAMILEVKIPKELNLSKIESALKDLGKKLSVDVTLKPIESLTL